MTLYFACLSFSSISCFVNQHHITIQLEQADREREIHLKQLEEEESSLSVGQSPPERKEKREKSASFEMMHSLIIKQIGRGKENREGESETTLSNKQSGCEEEEEEVEKL